MILSITDEGSRRLANLALARRHEVSARLDDWSEEELQAFVRSMARYNAALEAD
jgi:DNA-binding MarR family transcriptional regulator